MAEPVPTALGERLASAFSRDLLRGVVSSAAGAPSPEDPWKAASAAWRSADMATFIPAARRLAGEGRLKPMLQYRLGKALNEIGLFDEALEVLQACDPAEAPERDLALAQALGGLDRMAEARAALARAPRGGVHAALLETALTDEPGDAAPAPWARIGAQLDLAMGDVAGQALVAALARSPELIGEEALELGLAALRIASPGNALPILRGLAPLYRSRDERAAFKDAVKALRGEADEGLLIPLEGEDRARRARLLALLAMACAARFRWRAAVRRFGPLADELDLFSEGLRELSRCAGRDSLAEQRFRLGPPGPRRRIFNLSPFNGEYAILDLKLQEMAPWVERFVIVEAAQTFTGKPKPLYLRQDPSLLQRWGEKLIYEAIEAFPAQADTPWAREFYQRDLALRRLSGLMAAEDLLLVSDVDEIADRQAVEAFDGEYASLAMRTFVFFLNCELIPQDKPFLKTAVLKARYLTAAGPSQMRFSLSRYLKHDHVASGGWHFRSVNDPEALEWKAQSYSHQAFSHRDRSHFAKVLEAFRRGELGSHYERRDIDETFPAVIRDNRAALEKYIL